MIVFKAFLRVLNKCKIPVIMYTAFLIFFAGFNMQTEDSSMSFTADKPTVLIINKGENEGVTQNLIEYIEKNCDTADIKDEGDAISDALFYRDVNYIIYIPENYREDLLNGKNPEIEIKSTGDYKASYAEMLLSGYIKTANLYAGGAGSEEELIDKINQTLTKQAEIKITSGIDTDNLSRATFYYNFANYSILASCVYVICLILSSFNQEKVKNRMLISSMDYKKHNRILLLSNSLFAVLLWFLYVLLSFFMVGNIMFSVHGIIYIVNSLVFTICALTIAFLIGNLVNNKNAINGIVNVAALGSSFLCGAFVPVDLLPEGVLAAARILPSYWYIQTNEVLKTIEEFNLETLKPIFINTGMVILFSMVFVVISNAASGRKQLINR